MGSTWIFWTGCAITLFFSAEAVRLVLRVRRRARLRAARASSGRHLVLRVDRRRRGRRRTDRR